MADLLENNAAGNIHIRENAPAVVGGTSGATLLLLSPPIIQAIRRGNSVQSAAEKAGEIANKAWAEYHELDARAQQARAAGNTETYNALRDTMRGLAEKARYAGDIEREALQAAKTVRDLDGAADAAGETADIQFAEKGVEGVEAGTAGEGAEVATDAGTTVIVDEAGNVLGSTAGEVAADASIVVVDEAGIPIAAGGAAAAEGAAVDAATVDAAAIGSLAAADPAAAAAAAAAGAAGAEAGGEAAAIAGTGLMMTAAGGLIVTGVALAFASVILGALCVTHILPMCKKRVCRDVRGRWHSHSSHCNPANGCYDKNNQWHRHHDHCTNQKCQGPDHWWHKHQSKCDGKPGCLDPNGDWHMHKHRDRCEQKHWVCKDYGEVGRWHHKKKDCVLAERKRDLVAERDAAFANPDLLSVENSYIVITNAANFNPTELDVLKHMVIHPAETDEYTHASFETSDGSFYAEGDLSAAQPYAGTFSGTFTFTYPHTENVVQGKWVSADPNSTEENAKKLLGEIKNAHAKVAKAAQ